MKTAIKLFVVSACIVLGMTSCLKNSDPEFGFTQVGGYMLQRNNVTSEDTIASFAPYVLFSVNEAIAKASVTSPSFPLGISGKINTYYWESNVSAYEYLTDLGEESYTITATNAAGEKAILTIQMGVDKAKAIGEFEAKFTYDSKTGLTVEWDAPKNANYYELFVSEIGDSSVKGTLAQTSEKQITFSNYDASKVGLKTGSKYKFELFAYMVENNLFKVKLINSSGNNQFVINSWGTDNSVAE